MRAFAAVAALSLVLFLSACGISRQDAGQKATAFCHGHGGVHRFWYHTQAEDEKHAYEVTCKDGRFEAREE